MEQVPWQVCYVLEPSNLFYDSTALSISVIPSIKCALKNDRCTILMR